MGHRPSGHRPSGHRPSGHRAWKESLIPNAHCPMTAGATTLLTRATHSQTYAQCSITD
jgi:hypothetical protein